MEISPLTRWCAWKEYLDSNANNVHVTEDLGEELDRSGSALWNRWFMRIGISHVRALALGVIDLRSENPDESCCYEWSTKVKYTIGKPSENIQHWVRDASENI